MKRLPLVTGLLAACSAGLSLPRIAPLLEFNRLLIAQGEVWRLFTASFTHFNGDHLRWDLVVFVGLGACVEYHSRWTLVWCVALASVMISAALWIAQPQLAFYRGLSGVDSALFGYLVVVLIRTAWSDNDPRSLFLSGMGLAAFLAKIAWEGRKERSVFVDAGQAFVPVPLAHLFGLAVGGMIAVVKIQLHTDHAIDGDEGQATEAGSPCRDPRAT